MRLDCPRQKTGQAKALVASPLRSSSDLFPHNAIREIVRIEELTDRLYSISHRNHVLTRKLGVVRGSRHGYGIITLKILLCRSKREIAWFSTVERCSDLGKQRTIIGTIFWTGWKVAGGGVLIRS